MKKDNNEVWIGGNKIYLGEDNILYGIAEGDIDDEMALKINEVVLHFANHGKYEGDRLNTLVDVNKAGKHSSKARKIWGELAEHEKAGKIAYFGLHPVARILAAFIMGVSKKKDLRFFKTKEEAITWLKQDE